MSVLIFGLVCFAVGCMLGALVYRNNRAKADAAVAAVQTVGARVAADAKAAESAAKKAADAARKV